jgi:hypothetical protein
MKRGVLHSHKHHPKIFNFQIYNPTPTQLEKWMALVIGIVTFTYIHPRSAYKNQTWIYEKNIQIFQKKTSTFTTCKKQVTTNKKNV